MRSEGTNNIVLALNSLEEDTWEHFNDVGNVIDFLQTKFDVFPDNARIYHECVAGQKDVTPWDEASIAYLLSLEGTFFVISYPEGDPFTIIAIILSVVAVAAAIFLRPKVPVLRNQNQGSSNNELSDRTNKVRLGSRIPSIYGTVNSTPDLLSSYSVYENNIEVEYAYMCIGSGYYSINPSQIYDDSTAIANITSSTTVMNIPGTSVCVYDPYTSPNSGTPSLTLGTPITDPVQMATRCTSVNGQVLRPPNINTVNGVSNIVMGYPNTVTINDPTSVLDFTTYFQAGDSVNITNANYGTTGTTTSDFSGTYLTVSVSPHVITLNNPSSVNSAWSTLTPTSSATYAGSPSINTTGTTWVGPFLLSPIAVGTSTVNIGQVWANFIALNGLYADDGTNQVAEGVALQLEITPLDINNNPIGAAETQSINMLGSNFVRTQVAVTLKMTPSVPAIAYSVRASRSSNTDTGFRGTVVDEVQWRDVTAIIPVPQAHFGNVTTVQSVTQATTGALAVKDRKLNMIVTRKLPAYLGSNTFSTTLYPTTNAADIMSAICLDPVIGNRTTAEVNFDNFYSTIANVASYFGTSLCTDFCYTFDSDNLSFEETLATVAHTVFCTAYRRGSTISLSFEQKTAQSTMLFNHRNKMPNSETRSVRFGIEKDYDGVEFTWVSPLDNSTQTFYIPSDMSALSPEKVESQGVRNNIQASMQANRIWNKLQYQNVTVEFEGMQESDLLLLNDRIQLTDSTRAGTQDGEVLGQSGLTLNLSQPLTLTDSLGLTIFLQYYDESVESIPVYATSNPYSVTLSRAPRMPLYLDIDAAVRTTYIITGNSSKTPSAYLVQERTPQAKMTNKVVVVNYDDRYYQNDTDHINGLI